ncbi:MAG: hypothetical protein JJU27_13315 [Gammaproteobacteria bacterium]|nr:hypothetical protein [Gammaproteobacteria bacterium]
MPYPRAHLVLLALVPLTLLAFWPSYFSRLGDVSLAFHLHGVTASLWLMMLIAQSWLIQRRSVALHRLAGRASFVLVPAFLAGGLLLLKAMAQHATMPAQPLMQIYGTRLGILDVIAMGGFAGLYFGALANRRSVQLHARYMLATPLLLLSPTLTRILVVYLPPLTIRSPEDFALFGTAVQVSNAIALLIAIALYASAPRHGRAFAITAGLIVLQILTFQWVGDMSWWRGLYLALAKVPDAALTLAGLGFGLAIIGLALSSPRRKVVTA